MDPWIHAVWQDFRNGKWQIFYRRSEDGGTTWQTTDTVISNDVSLDFGDNVRPRIASNGDQILAVVWRAFTSNPTSGHREERAMLQLSVDGGNTWGNALIPMNFNFFLDVNLAPEDPADSPNWVRDVDVRFDSTNNVLYSVWMQNEGGPDQVCFFQIDFNAATLQLARVISLDGGGNPSQDTPERPSLGNDESRRVYVAYAENPGGTNPTKRLKVVRSVDAGVTFGPAVELHQELRDYDETAIAVDGSTVVVGWLIDSVPLRAASTHLSTDAGVTWSSAKQINDQSGILANLNLGLANGVPVACYSVNPGVGPGFDVYASRYDLLAQEWAVPTLLEPFTPGRGLLPYPALGVAGNDVFIVWSEALNADENSYADVYGALSSDGGVTWGPNTKINNQVGMTGVARADHPEVIVTGDKAFVLWDDRRHFDPPDEPVTAPGRGAPEAYFARFGI